MNKSIDVLVGCQFGSEGKGLVAGILATIYKYDWLVSVNSAQAGHTVYYHGEPIITRHIPSSAVINHLASIYIGAGAIINIPILIKEIEMLEDKGIPIIERLNIHDKALIIEKTDIDYERDRGDLITRIGSTGEGVGMALSKRVLREAKLFGDYNKESSYFKNKINDYFVINIIKGNILLEGSQGFGLSNFSSYYPFCTSRDTTTSAFLSYARFNPKYLQHVYGVFRTYPIRVGGNSGQMYNELSWEKIANRSGYKHLIEKTTVTKRIRRVGEWDSNLAKIAVAINGVDRPILTFTNYISNHNEGVSKWGDLTKDTVDFINKTNSDVGNWWLISTDKFGTYLIPKSDNI